MAVSVSEDRAYFVKLQGKVLIYLHAEKDSVEYAEYVCMLFDFAEHGSKYFKEKLKQWKRSCFPNVAGAKSSLSEGASMK